MYLVSIVGHFEKVQNMNSVFFRGFSGVKGRERERELFIIAVMSINIHSVAVASAAHVTTSSNGEYKPA